MTSRVPGAVALLVTGLVLTGCGGGSGPGPDRVTGPAVDVATQVGEQLAASGLAADPGTLDCEGALPAEVGASVRCSFTSEGQPVDLVARAASVDGPTVDVAITTEARPVSADVLATAVTERFALETVGSFPDTVCDGDLAPTVGTSTTCTLSSGDVTRKVRATVTSVEGGSIAYSIDNA